MKYSRHLTSHVSTFQHHLQAQDPVYRSYYYTLSSLHTGTNYIHPRSTKTSYKVSLFATHSFNPPS